MGINSWIAHKIFAQENSLLESFQGQSVLLGGRQTVFLCLQTQRGAGQTAGKNI